MAYNNLTAEESRVIIDKGTESPFTGEYDTLFQAGTFMCRRCNTPLFSAQSKFDSGCGWPSFDQTFPEAVTRHTDADGHRTEILCSHCHAHLGHVFEGENLTNLNTRHCVNSLSIRFIAKGKALPEVLNDQS